MWGVYTCGNCLVHEKSSSITRIFTESEVLEPRYLGDINFIISFKNLESKNQSLGSISFRSGSRSKPGSVSRYWKFLQDKLTFSTNKKISKIFLFFRLFLWWNLVNHSEILKFLYFYNEFPDLNCVLRETWLQIILWLQ